MKKILLLGSQHGNELLGEGLFKYIKKYRKDIEPYVIFKIANVKAHNKKIRYVESDMNRSYVSLPRTYEERQAKRLLAYIREEAFDLVLDLHTTRCHQPPSFIVGSFSKEVEQFVVASNIEYVVHMNHTIVEASLIGKRPNAVSIEVQDDELSDNLYQGICDDIERYIQGRKSKIRKYYFEITDLIYKNELTEQQAESLVNFKKSNLGFYPILMGENSYKKQTNYLGFKAQRITSIKEGSRV